MGNHVVGLDVGTHAVRAVELSFGRGRPVVERIAQVGLPRGAVVAGEVVDMPAVSSALRRLWREGGFSRREVVVGVANARVVARVADLPKLPLDELRSGLRYQVQDLIPIPVDDAELDFQVIDEHVGETPDERMRVLLVAAHRDMLRSLLASLEGAGLRASRVDLIPFALIRSLGGAALWDGPEGPEVIVASGAGVTNVVVHQHGIAQFARTLPVGGAVVTEALADELGVDADHAESMKRLDGDTAGASAAVMPLVSDVSGSLDFHLAQAQDELQRVVISGGGARLEAFRRVLEDQLAVPVVDGTPFEKVELPKALAEVAADGDVFAVAIGLALGGTGTGVSLLPSEVAAKRVERRHNMLAAGGVGGFAAALLALTVLRSGQIDDARHRAGVAEQSASRLQTQVTQLNDISKLEDDITTGRAAVAAALKGDVVWPDLIRDVATVIPDDVWLTGFTGSGATLTQAASIKVNAKGAEQASAARWLLRMSDLPGVSNVWLQNSKRGSAEGGARPSVEFSSSADLTPPAQSPRLGLYTGEEDQ